MDSQQPDLPHHICVIRDFKLVSFSTCVYECARVCFYIKESYDLMSLCHFNQFHCLRYELKSTWDCIQCHTLHRVSLHEFSISILCPMCSVTVCDIVSRHYSGVSKCKSVQTQHAPECMTLRNIPKSSLFFIALP